MGSKIGISRRGLLTSGLGGVAGTLFGSSFGLRAQEVKLPELTSVPASLKGSGEVVVSSYVHRAFLYEPFEKLTGIKIVQAPATPPAKFKAMVDTKNTNIDILNVSNYEALYYATQGDYLEPIDYGLFDAGYPEQLKRPYQADMYMNAQVIAYRTDVFGAGKGPQDYTDFWNAEKFPGPRALSSALNGMFLEVQGALIADGVARDQLYPADIDRVFGSLDKIKKHVVKWWDNPRLAVQMIADREVVMTNIINARTTKLIKNNVPIERVWKDGMSFTGGSAIAKGAPNKANALKLMAFIASPVMQARLALEEHFGYVNPRASEYMSEEIAKELPSWPANYKMLTPLDDKWWSVNQPILNQRYAKWILQ